MKSIEAAGRCDFHAVRTTQGLPWEAAAPRTCGFNIHRVCSSPCLAHHLGSAEKRGGFAQRTASREAHGKVAGRRLARERCRSRARSYLGGFSLQIPCRQSLLNSLNWLFLSCFFGKLRISFLIKTDGGRPDWAPRWRGCDIRHISRFAGSLAASQGSRAAVSLNPNPGTRVSAQSAADTTSQSAARSVRLMRTESA